MAKREPKRPEVTEDVDPVAGIQQLIKQNEMLQALYLREQEREAVYRLSEAWKAFCALPEEHPNDKGEFLRALHHCQQIVLCRAGRRLLKEKLAVDHSEALP